MIAVGYQVLKCMQIEQSKIFVDFRENRSKVPKLLPELGVGVQTADLAADYIISRDCWVERKTVLDFITSIADRRRNQVSLT